MSKINNLRLFLGIDLAPAVADALGARARALESELKFRNWTPPADYHVTLHFLGETPAERLDAIAGAAAEAAMASVPLALALAGPSTFGAPDAPRVLWCGLAEPEAAKGALAALHAALGERLARAAGYAPEARPYRAHVTLARKGLPGSGGPEAVAAAWHRAEARAAAAGGGPSALAWAAPGVTLFRTHAGRRPSYERLAVYPFGGSC